MRFLGRLVRFEGKLHGPLGMFVCGQVIFFSMMNRGSAMGVRGLFVKFSGALVRIVRHDDPFWHKLRHVLVNFRVQHGGRLYCIERRPTRIRA